MGQEPVFGLQWGVKPSFLDYVARMHDGRMSVTDGATTTDGAVFAFEPDPGATDAEAGRFAFRGDVRFSAHAGMMFVRLADPRVTVSGSRAELTVLDPADRDGGSRLPLVTCTLEPRPTEEALRIWLATDVALTAEGAGLFNDVYAVGEPFAPLAIFLPLA